MICKIRERDLNFGKNIKVILSECSYALTIFLRDCDGDFPVCHNCSEGFCFPHQIRDELTKNSPSFLELLWKFYKEIELDQRNSFLHLTTIVVGILYSAYEKRVPIMSEHFISNAATKFTLISAGSSNEDYLYRTVVQNLDGLNQNWRKELCQMTKEIRIEPPTWKKTLFLLEIFREGMEPVDSLDENSRKPFFQRIQDYLKH